LKYFRLLKGEKMAFSAIKGLAAISAMSAALISFQMREHQIIEQRSSTQSAEQLQQSITQTIAQTKLARHVSTFGFDNFVADVMFIQFLQFFGDTEARQKTGYSASSDFFAAVLRHDSQYKPFYLFLSSSSTLYAANPERTVELMAEGLKSLSPNQPPDSYYIWRYKAVDELLFLGDGKASQKSFETAANWARQSTDPAGKQISSLSQKTADFLASNPNSRAAQIDAWSSLLSTALDKETRERAIRKIEDLGGSVVFSEDGSIQILHKKAEGLSEPT
jgi:hypothetical protein